MTTFIFYRLILLALLGTLIDWQPVAVLGEPQITTAACPIGKKPTTSSSGVGGVGNECVYLNNDDVSRAVRALAYPPMHLVEPSLPLQAPYVSTNSRGNSRSVGIDRYANMYFDYGKRCKNFTVSQGIHICEDYLPLPASTLSSTVAAESKCLIYSIIATAV